MATIAHSPNTYTNTEAVGPAQFRGAATITPSDTDVHNPPVGVYVGGAGNVAIVDEFGNAAVTFTAPGVGAVLPVRALKIMATNTTATLLIALF